jgi:selenocysteine-specific elongation factor
MTQARVIVGTAGHIDHGKTSLVRALTGVDLDRLPEEKDRGITIALGFAPLDLPDGGRVAFVDVPGHEKLVRTMVAGATGIDAALLCVSAVDGVMPQTREHVAILGLLGLHEGAVVLTMADLVDAELLELAREDVAGLVAGTFLEGKPIVAWSAVSGAGRAELLGVLGGFAARERPSDGPFRLPVDRGFVRPGFGTVVTGTSASGIVHDGDAVIVWPAGRSTRVRGIQVHGEAAESASAGARVALNLAGIEKDDVPRGSVVAIGAIATSSILDVRYTQLAGVGELPDDVAVRVLHGTAERLGRLHIAEDRDAVPAGATVWAQIRLEAPLPCMPGDRFVVRRPSPQETLGGGVIIDPWAPKLRTRDRGRWPPALERLARGDKAVWLERAGEAGLSADEWAVRGGGPGAVTLGDRLVAPTVIARLEGALLESLERYHAENPLSLGPSRRELRRERLAHLSDRSFDALVDRLVSVGTVKVEGPILRFGAFRVALTAGQQALRERLTASFVAAGFGGLLPKALHEKHPEPEVAAVVGLLENAGAITPVADLGWVSTDALDDLEKRVRTWFSSHPELTPGDFKELTGLSRKAAIPWLEWLDRTKKTKRVGDARIKGPGLQ